MVAALMRAPDGVLLAAGAASWVEPVVVAACVCCGLATAGGIPAEGAAPATAAPAAGGAGAAGALAPAAPAPLPVAPLPGTPDPIGAPAPPPTDGDDVVIAKALAVGALNGIRSA